MKVDGVYSAVQQNMGIEKAKDSYTGKSFLEICEDIATENAAGIQAVTEENEYAGMSDVEIYLAIEEKYKNLYGEDFLDKQILGIMPDSYEEVEIVSWYDKKLRTYIGNDDKIKSVAREALYGDMTDEEIRAKLIYEYIKPNMTYGGYMRMTYEMQRVGVDEGLREVGMMFRGCDEHGKYLIGASIKEKNNYKNNYYIDILDKSLNLTGLANHTNGIKSANNPRYSYMTTKLVSQIFNIPIGSDGYLDIPKKTENVDLQELYWNRYMKSRENLLQEWWMKI